MALKRSIGLLGALAIVVAACSNGAATTPGASTGPGQSAGASAPAKQ